MDYVFYLLVTFGPSICARAYVLHMLPGLIMVASVAAQVDKVVGYHLRTLYRFLQFYKHWLGHGPLLL